MDQEKIPDPHHEMDIKEVMNQHSDCNLSLEQAERIYAFKQRKRIHSREHYFSFWEELDYDMDHYQEILDEEQLQCYLTQREFQVKNHESNLISQEDRQEGVLAYNEAVIGYYLNVYFAQTQKIHMAHLYWLFHENRDKVDYLKSQYKKFLDNDYKERLVSHYRRVRRFMPKTLQASLLGHRQGAVMPDYFRFRPFMDEPTKRVAEHLLNGYEPSWEKSVTLYTSMEEELNAFLLAAKEKHIGDIRGWHSDIKWTEEMKKHQMIMRFVLRDKDFYGW